MKKEPQKSAVRLVIVLYAAALVCWIGLGVFRLSRGMWYQQKGLRQREILTLAQLEQVGIRPFEAQEQGEWYVSSDADPQLILKREIYLEKVILRMKRPKEGLAAVLYFKEADQQNYSEQKAVYAQEKEPGVFEFDLKGKKVSEIRIDPDSVGGVITRFDGLELNPKTGFLWAFRPSWKGILLALTLPLFGAAFILEIVGMCKQKRP